MEFLCLWLAWRMDQNLSFLKWLSSCSTPYIKKSTFASTYWEAPTSYTNFLLWSGIFLDLFFCFIGLSIHVPQPHHFSCKDFVVGFNTLFGYSSLIALPFTLFSLDNLPLLFFFSHKLYYLVRSICLFSGRKRFIVSILRFHKI